MIRQVRAFHNVRTRIFAKLKISKKGLDKTEMKWYNGQAEKERYAGVAKLADARDLKSRGTLIPYRFEPGFRHHNIAGWSSWQLVGLITRRS